MFFSCNLHALFFSSFFFFSKKLPIVVVRDVCPSVRLSVSLSVRLCQIISFRGNLISSKPIDRPECPLGGGACPKGVIFRNSNCKLQICAICNFFANEFVCTVLTDLLSRLC